MRHAKKMVDDAWYVLESQDEEPETHERDESVLAGLLRAMARFIFVLPVTRLFSLVNK